MARKGYFLPVIGDLSETGERKRAKTPWQHEGWLSSVLMRSRVVQGASPIRDAPGNMES